IIKRRVASEIVKEAGSTWKIEELCIKISHRTTDRNSRGQFKGHVSLEALTTCLTRIGSDKAGGRGIERGNLEVVEIRPISRQIKPQTPVECCKLYPCFPSLGRFRTQRERVFRGGRLRSNKTARFRALSVRGIDH